MALVKGCIACMKYLLFAFNFLILLCGCALVAVGLYLCFEPTVEEYADASGDLEEYYIAVYVIIGIGGIMMLIGFLGCCGACMENAPLLGLFFVFLLLICVAEVGGGIWCYLNREELKKIVTEGMKDSMTNVYNTDNNVMAAVDTMQQKLQCCGAEMPSDWLENTELQPPLPDSCCITAGCSSSATGNMQDFYKTQKNTDSPLIYISGCSDELFSKLEENSVLVAGLVIGIGAVQLLGMIFSLCLCCAIRRSDDNKSYAI
ncbi:CD9 antigen-like isoform X2 [Amphiura filiformis]|uniref:CD9 antigen-like isoform X2 n=1 Tax=Amphiura filiformis TaxID=82378 RepID=UPI003B225784